MLSNSSQLGAIPEVQGQAGRNRRGDMRSHLDTSKAGFRLKVSRLVIRQKLALPITKLMFNQGLLAAVACLG